MIRGGAPGAADFVALALVVLFAVAIAFATWRLALREGGSSRGAERRSGLLGAVQRRPLLAYFVLAYGMTWLFWMPFALGANGARLLPLGLPMALMAGGPLGPIGAGFLMTAIASGRSGVRDLRRRLFLWRVGAGWHAFAVFGPPVLIWLGVVLVSAEARSGYDVSALLAALPLFAVFFVLQLFMSGLFEEPGWRGFALPRLQERYAPLWGSIVLGLCWGCWHFPLFLIPGIYVAGSGLAAVGIPFAQSLVMAVAMSVMFTWVFNHTRASVLIAVMLHAALNAGWGLQATVLGSALPHVSDLQFPARMVGVGIFALLVVALTRGRLGYRGQLPPERAGSRAP